jgi:hypothetical protein
MTVVRFDFSSATPATVIVSEFDVFFFESYFTPDFAS